MPSFKFEIWRNTNSSVVINKTRRFSRCVILFYIFLQDKALNPSFMPFQLLLHDCTKICLDHFRSQLPLLIRLIREKIYSDWKVLEALYSFQFYANKLFSTHNMEMNHGDKYIQVVLGLWRRNRSHDVSV
jgi:hypothetical protein